jgi:VWFA-related protein
MQVRLALVLCLATAFAQESPIIRVHTHLVSLPALVFDKQGMLLAGLKKTDFQVLDNGYVQDFQINSDEHQYSLVVVIQASQSVRGYLPMISKVASTLESSLQAATGEAAVIAYEDDVALLKPFESRELENSVKRLSAGGERARLFDALVRALNLLESRADSRSKIILLIGQSFDSGSDSKLSAVQSMLAEKNVSVFCLTLPWNGKSFIADTFSLSGRRAGGFAAGVELTKLGPVLKRSITQHSHVDAFTLLSAQTGGVETHFRKQTQLEDALIGLGGALRSAYTLTYSPNPPTPGRHNIAIEIARSGATVHARNSYAISANDSR